MEDVRWVDLGNNLFKEKEKEFQHHLVIIPDQLSTIETLSYRRLVPAKVIKLEIFTSFLPVQSSLTRLFHLL